MGDSSSTVGYSVHWGITSVHAGITSVLWRVFSTVRGYLQYCGGITAVHVVVQYRGDNISTVRDSFSTVGVFSSLGNNISTRGG